MVKFKHASPIALIPSTRNLVVLDQLGEGASLLDATGYSSGVFMIITTCQREEVNEGLATLLGSDLPK